MATGPDVQCLPPHHRFPPSPYYRFFRIAAQNLQPRLSVELGVCGGGGSYHLATGYAGGKVIGIDVVEDYKDNTDFIQEHCPNFELWLGDSIELSSEVWLRHGQVDFLFIDTVHTYERTLTEFDAWELHLSENAIVCLDDLNRDGMTEAFNELPGQKVRLDMLHSGKTEGGFGVVWNFNGWK